MGLPDFLVIGAARAGTTWLDGVLRSHPGIFMPTNRKEVHFFDKHFELGVAWYEKYFPDEDHPANVVRGETTPRYLYDPSVPLRIHKTVPNAKLIAILRSPVDRAYSHYGIVMRDHGYRGSFEELLRENPRLLDYGLYSEQLARYAALWKRTDMHLIIFEDAIRNRVDTFEGLGDFLDVAPEQFTIDARQANETFIPRFPRTRMRVRQVGVQLRKRGLDRLVEAGKSSGVGRGFGNLGGLPEMSHSTRSRLLEHFTPEVDRMEDLLGRELPSWRH